MIKNSTRNIIKKDISKNIFKNFGSSLNFSDKFIDQTIDILITELINSNSVKIKNFGVFKILNKKERIGRNPKTKIEHTIKSRKVVSFKASSYLKNKINVNYER